MHNRTKPLAKDVRVGLYIYPDTRERLNRLKAEILLKTGRVMSQDEVLTLLFDHFADTAPAQLDRVVAG